MSKIYTPYNNIFIILLLILLAALSDCIAEEKEISSSALSPLKVIDGDSMEIGTTRIRLIGIDAPEYMQYCKTPDKKDYPCGKNAADFLRSLTSNGQITCKIHKKDKYKRNLCTCYVNGTDINAEMVRNGHAVVYMESPYNGKQEEAKRNKRGIWNGRFMQPRLFRKLKEEQNKQNLNFKADSY